MATLSWEDLCRNSDPKLFEEEPYEYEFSANGGETRKFYGNKDRFSDYD